MFTGLVADIGTIMEMQRGPRGAMLTIRTSFKELVLGESIATDGVCLTVTRIRNDGFVADASVETLTRTTLQFAERGQAVHLERALSVGERLGGHLVSGHVDAIGKLVEKSPLGDAVKFIFEVPSRIAPFIAPKGSITIDGTSLTVNGVNANRFDIALVPFSQTKTTFATRPIGARVNLEVDILAKYVASLLGRPGIDGSESAGVTAELLERHGFMDVKRGQS